jgi:hypothetical protein
MFKMIYQLKIYQIILLLQIKQIHNKIISIMIDKLENLVKRENNYKIMIQILNCPHIYKVTVLIDLLPNKKK